MDVRKVSRAVQRLGRSLLIVDRSVPRPAGRVVLLSCHDVDRSMQSRTGRFSPILEGIRELLEPLGLSPVNLTHPQAFFSGRSVKGGATTVNHGVLSVRMRAFLRRLVAGPVAAAEWRFKREVALYSRLLRTVSPELVLSIQPPAALCVAAKALGVRVVEAMHGTNMSLSDPIFGAHMRSPDEVLPDAVISFDDVTHATVSKHFEGRTPLSLRGIDPWLHSLRRRSSDAPAPSAAGRTVLVTLQWGYDGERDSLSGVVPNGILHPAVERAIEGLGRAGVAVGIRMHPVQLNSPGYRRHRQYIEALARRLPHVEFERASAEPLPLLLDQASAHLTMSSSSVGEAVAAGVPTLLLCPTLHAGGANHGLFRELEPSGLATFGRLDADGISSWIDEQLSIQRERPLYDVASRHESEVSFYGNLLAWARGVKPPEVLQRIGEFS